MLAGDLHRSAYSVKTANKALERANSHRGRAVLAMDYVLAGAESAPGLAAQLSL